MSELLVQGCGTLGSSTSIGQKNFCVGCNCPMKWPRSYLTVDFENFSLDTLKMAVISHYDVKASVNEG